MSSSKGRHGHLFKFIAILLVASVWICLRYGNRIRRFHRPSSQTFTVNYSANTFRMDGRPFRFVSGEFHYFRSPQERWREILRKIRSAGLNAVSTYVGWSSHEAQPGTYSFDGHRDVEYFMRLAAEEGLYVLLYSGFSWTMKSSWDGTCIGFLWTK
ncbi:hypothetical protein M8J76_001194 [Diaphorina citri]|nr:hypothetical protein M8J76_001194 [Diaphorina citri]